MINVQEKKMHEVQSSITMIVLLVSFSMLFGTLFMGYMVFRVRATVWPPMGMDDIGLFYPTMSTLIIFFSSITYYLFENDFQKNKISAARGLLLASLLLGIGFCISQLLVWNHLTLKGITQSSGIFGSMIYGFTWIHFAHIAIGILLLIWLNFNFKNFSQVDFKNHLKIKNIGMFWHFLGLIWLIIYLILFVF